MPLLPLTQILLTWFKQATTSHKREIFGYNLAMKSVILCRSNQKASVKLNNYASTKLKGIVDSNRLLYTSNFIPF